ncbi:MAG: hypothetical protein K1X29_03635 [Bdellovibrionales bacterium]|nr:hypothetical protein [Bdellovibrionales bacterium]
MSVHKLVEAVAFSGMTQLWVIPDPQNSGWARLIDWYVNFQMIRAQNHQKPQFSGELLHMLDELGLLHPTTEDFSHRPLLLDSSLRLPVQQLISLPFTSDLKSWLENCAEIIKKLNVSSFRIFLPQGITYQQVEKYGSSLWSVESQVGVVVDKLEPMT